MHRFYMGALGAVMISLAVPGRALASPDTASNAPRWTATLLPLRVGIGCRVSEQIVAYASDAVRDAMVNSTRFVLVARRHDLDPVVMEQILGSSGGIDPSTRAEMNRLTGAQLVIAGEISEASSREGRQEVGPFTISSMSASVTVDLRAIDTTTGRLLVSEIGPGRAQDQGFRIDITDEHLNIKDVDRSVMGKACRQAASSVVAQLEKDMPPPIIASVESDAGEGAVVYIRTGSVKIFNVGDLLEVVREGDPVYDPDDLDKPPANRRILTYKETHVGRCRVFEVQERAVLARVSSGDGFQIRDLVRRLDGAGVSVPDPSADRDNHPLRDPTGGGEPADDVIRR